MANRDQPINRDQAAAILGKSPKTVWYYMRRGIAIYGHDRRIMLHCVSKGAKLLTTRRWVRAFQRECQAAEDAVRERTMNQVPFKRKAG